MRWNRNELAVTGGLFHYHWWTALIKPRLLFPHAGCASWGLFPFYQFNCGGEPRTLLDDDINAKNDVTIHYGTNSIGSTTFLFCFINAQPYQAFCKCISIVVECWRRHTFLKNRNLKMGRYKMTYCVTFFVIRDETFNLLYVLLRYAFDVFSLIEHICESINCIYM